MDASVSLLLHKRDKGYKASIVTWDGGLPPAWVKLDISNRQFKCYSPGDYIEAVAKVSPTGRLYIKSHSLHTSKRPVLVTASPKREEVVMPFVDKQPAPTKEEKNMQTQTQVPQPTEETSRIQSLLSGYYIPEEARMLFTTALRMSQARPERAVKMMVVGASGFGKTTIPKLFSEIIGFNHMRMNCGSIRDPEEWFGFREAREGSTVFIRSQFMKMLEAGNAVIVLDEFNRLEPWLHNTLFPLLDDDGKTVVHDEEFTIGPNVIVVGTINRGYQYTGTFELDEALLNRFDFILEVGPMPSVEEAIVLVERTGIVPEQAKEIVKMANILRQNDFICTTRSTLLISAKVKAGLTIREAFESAVVRRIPVDSASGSQRKSVVDLVNANLGPFQVRKLPDDVFTYGPVAPAIPVVEQEPEPEPASTSTTGLVPTFILRKAEGKELNVVDTIRLIRQLPTEETLSFGRVQAMVKAMVQGKYVSVPITHKPENFDEIISSFKANNVAGRFGTMEFRSAGILEEETL